MPEPTPPREPVPMLIWILLGGGLIFIFCLLLFLLHPPEAGVGPTLPQLVPGKPVPLHPKDAKPMSAS